MESLKRLFEIQKFLQEINYPDHIRVAKEIDTFTDQNPQEDLSCIFQRLKADEPWDYIRGYSEFCNNRFTVNRNVLIPRIETEQLVYDTVEYIKSLNQEITLIDIGTGSGCIAISIASLLPNLDIIATDISKDALEVAKINEGNILKNKQIKWVNTNLLEGVKPKHLAVITANLPYIPTEQYLQLDPSVKDYEPRISLELTAGLYENMYKQVIFPTAGLFMETECSVIEQHFESAQVHFRDKFDIEKKNDLFDRDRFIYIKSK